jgi:hypothetical protein
MASRMEVEEIMDQNHSGFFLPPDIRQELIDLLSKQSIRKGARLYNALQNLPLGHMVVPATQAPRIRGVVNGPTEDGSP